MQHLKGKTSDDGKSFSTDNDNKTYENSEKVKGHEAHAVVLGDISSTSILLLT